MASVDIINGQVGSVDIGNGQVTTADIASGAIQQNVHIVQNQFYGSTGAIITGDIDCPSGEILTSGGFSTFGGPNIRVLASFPEDADTWRGVAFNAETSTVALRVYALCIDPTLP